jgi:thioredoxin-like negative regulator of GroEL
MNDSMVVLDIASYNAFTSANDCLVIIYKERCPYCEVVFKVIGKCIPSCPDLKTAKIDSEKNPEILATLGASKVPTVIVYGKGEEKGRRSGVMNPAELSALIDKMA